CAGQDALDHQTVAGQVRLPAGRACRCGSAGDRADGDPGTAPARRVSGVARVVVLFRAPVPDLARQRWAPRPRFDPMVAPDLPPCAATAFRELTLKHPGGPFSGAVRCLRVNSRRGEWIDHAPWSPGHAPELRPIT